MEERARTTLTKLQENSRRYFGKEIPHHQPVPWHCIYWLKKYPFLMVRKDKTSSKRCNKPISKIWWINRHVCNEPYHQKSKKMYSEYISIDLLLLYIHCTIQLKDNIEPLLLNPTDICIRNHENAYRKFAIYFMEKTMDHRHTP